jgi:acetyltransferase-like isoleucine patch superfamily enzyme
MTTPFMNLIRNGVDILEPEATRLTGLRGTMTIESPVWLARGRYVIGRLGCYSYIGEDALFLHTASVGRFCSIARRVTVGESEHPTWHLSTSPIFFASRYWQHDSAMAAFYACNREIVRAADRDFNEAQMKILQPTVIGHDVWVGEGAFIRRGVKIGHGAVIGGRAVVTKDVPPYAIVGGAPAKVIRYRFDERTIARLLELSWWEQSLSGLDGVPWHVLPQALDMLEERKAKGLLTPMTPKTVTWPN